MGYRTHYELIFQPFEYDEVLKAFQEVCGWMSEDDFLAMLDGCMDAMKWYSHTEDLVKVSKKVPHIKFSLFGEGEECGDLWKLYVFNGKTQRETAQITYNACKLW